MQDLAEMTISNLELLVYGGIAVGMTAAAFLYGRAWEQLSSKKAKEETEPSMTEEQLKVKGIEDWIDEQHLDEFVKDAAKKGMQLGLKQTEAMYVGPLQYLDALKEAYEDGDLFKGIENDPKYASRLREVKNAGIELVHKLWEKGVEERETPTERTYRLAYKKLHESFSKILKEKDPSVYESRGYQNCGFMWYGISHSMDKAKPEVRKELAKAFFEFADEVNDQKGINTIFSRYATAEECRTQVGEPGERYCAKLDVTIDASGVHHHLNARGDVREAGKFADKFDLEKGCQTS